LHEQILRGPTTRASPTSSSERHAHYGRLPGAPRAAAEPRSGLTRRLRRVRFSALSRTGGRSSAKSAPPWPSCAAGPPTARRCSAYQERRMTLLAERGLRHSGSSRPSS
jgi:hypothetical protein